MTTVQRLNRQLKNIVKLASQVEIDYRTDRELQDSWDDELDELGQSGLDIYYSAWSVRKQIKSTIEHRDQAQKVMTIIIDKLRDILQIVGEDGEGLSFLQATSRENLKVFIHFIVRFSEVFQQILEEMPENEFSDFYDIIDKARVNRS